MDTDTSVFRETDPEGLNRTENNSEKEVTSINNEGSDSDTMQKLVQFQGKAGYMNN